MNPYKILGVHINATQETITKAYRKKAMRFHPDRNPGDEKAASHYQEVQDAYNLLSDPERRSSYDRTGDVSQPRPRPAADFMELLIPLLNEALARGSLFGGNPLDTVRSRLNEVKAGHERRIGQAEHDRKTLTDVIGRITVEGDENYFETPLRNQLTAVNEMISSTKGELDKIIRAQEYLKKVRYRMDSKPSNSWSLAVTTSTTW